MFLFQARKLESFSDDVDWVKAVLAAYTKTYEGRKRETKRGCDLLGVRRQRSRGQTNDDAAAFGISSPKPKPKESTDFEVWDENWDAVIHVSATADPVAGFNEWICRIEV